MRGYYEGYSYVGYMPDGTKQQFATEKEYAEAYEEERSEDDGKNYRKGTIRRNNNGYS